MIQGDLTGRATTHREDKMCPQSIWSMVSQRDEKASLSSSLLATSLDLTGSQSLCLARGPGHGSSDIGHILPGRSKQKRGEITAQGVTLWRRDRRAVGKSSSKTAPKIPCRSVPCCCVTDSAWAFGYCSFVPLGIHVVGLPAQSVCVRWNISWRLMNQRVPALVRLSISIEQSFDMQHSTLRGSKIMW